MSSLSGRFDPAVGPLINIGIAPAGTLKPGMAIPASIATFPALLDTGASITCLSPHVAHTIGVKSLSMRPLVSVTHTALVPVYLVDVLLPFRNTTFILYARQVLEFSNAGNYPFQILIGRDIICRGILTLSFDGHFTFAI
jgi:hypothetical protein